METDALTGHKIKKVGIDDYLLPEGSTQDFDLTYQSFGLPLGKAPIVLINHPLTGNSEVIGENGWWNAMVGNHKSIDLKKYSILAFNTPGNGFGQSDIPDCRRLTTKIVADLYWKALDELGIATLFAVVGGSLGGSIAWEMAFLRPQAIAHLIPIACCLQSSDWLIGNVLVQEQILENSSRPIEDARRHAMLLYRTPDSLRAKFSRKTIAENYAVESWLNYHGNLLKDRFRLMAYKNMNHLLKTVGTAIDEQKIKEFAIGSSCHIHCIAIDRDYLFTQNEQYQTYRKIKRYHSKIDYCEIRSIHGHDAFLIEFEQLHNILTPIFL